jgi:hypothetical protein
VYILLFNNLILPADKVDGPYYLFKFIQHLRNNFGNWPVLPCIQGERLPLVPVDYVCDAMDALAHMPGLDGRCFHLVDSSPKLFVDALNIFATAAHAPQFSARLPNLALSFIPPTIMSKIHDNVPILAQAPQEVVSWVSKKLPRR